MIIQLAGQRKIEPTVEARLASAEPDSDSENPSPTRRRGKKKMTTILSKSNIPSVKFPHSPIKAKQTKTNYNNILEVQA